MARLFRRARTSGQLRDQLLRQLENEGEKLLKQMAAEFSQTLAGESQRVLKDVLSGMQSGEAFSSQGVSNILSTALNYVVSRPRISSATQESSRSKTTEQQFRLSRAQQASEAASLLAQGEKNA